MLASCYVHVPVEMNYELCHRNEELDFLSYYYLHIIKKLRTRLLTQINYGSFVKVLFSETASDINCGNEPMKQPLINMLSYK